MTSDFQKLQDAVVAKIKGIPAIAHAPNRDPDFYENLVIPVNAFTAGSIQNRFKIAMSKIGVSVIVRKGSLKQVGDFISFPFETEIVELSHFNRGELGSQITAEALAEFITTEMRNWQPDDALSTAKDINVAQREGDKRLSISLQFNFQGYAPRRKD